MYTFDSYNPSAVYCVSNILQSSPPGGSRPLSHLTVTALPKGEPYLILRLSKHFKSVQTIPFPKRSDGNEPSPLGEVSTFTFGEVGKRLTNVCTDLPLRNEKVVRTVYLFRPTSSKTNVEDTFFPKGEGPLRKRNGGVGANLKYIQILYFFIFYSIK